MDIPGIISALAGAAVTVISAYGAMKAKGIVLFPQEKIDSGREKIASLTEGNETAQKVMDTVGNVTSDEIIKILTRAEELSHGGYTLAEAQELGIMAVTIMGNK